MKRVFGLMFAAACVSCQLTSKDLDQSTSISVEPAILEMEDGSQVTLGAEASLSGEIVDLTNAGGIRGASFAEETQAGLAAGNPIGILTNEGAIRLIFEETSKRSIARPTGRHWQWGAHARQAAAGGDLRQRAIRAAGANATIHGIWTSAEGKPALLVKAIK